jgi:Lipase (class 3)
MDNLELERIGRLCAIGYRKDAKAIAAYAKLGYASQPLHGSHDLDEAYFLRRGTAAIVVVRGSDEVGDWAIRNFMFLQPLHKQHIHPGFRAGAQILSRRIRPLLNGIESLELIGHSKGGAISALLGPMLHQWQPVITTIGAPRFCGSAYAAKYPSQLIRIVNARDPIAHLPFAAAGYCDCGDAVVVGQAARSWWSAVVGGMRHHFDYGTEMRRLWPEWGWRNI